MWRVREEVISKDINNGFNLQSFITKTAYCISIGSVSYVLSLLSIDLIKDSSFIKNSLKTEILWLEIQGSSNVILSQQICGVLYHLLLILYYTLYLSCIAWWHPSTSMWSIKCWASSRHIQNIFTGVGSKKLKLRAEMKQKISVRSKGCSTKFNLLGAPQSVQSAFSNEKKDRFLVKLTNTWRSCLYDFAADYDDRSKLLSPAIRILLRQSITLKYTEPLNPNLAGQGSLLLACLSLWFRSQRTPGNPSSTASLCHIFFSHKTLIRLWIRTAGLSNDASAKTFSTMLEKICEKIQNVQIQIVTLSSFFYHSFITFCKTLIFWHECE